MRLKYLSLCLLGLSLSGCAQHVIKSNSIDQNQSTAQRAIQGVNAIYEYPNFDYRGGVKLKIEQNSSQVQKNAKKMLKSTDRALEEKLNQYLKQQNIQLSHVQKQAVLQQALKNENSSLTEVFGKGAGYFESILKDLQFNYDGTVNYRQKIATFNVDTKYQKPNLLVHARIPSVIDFKESKFYSNIFSLMPYLANPQDQNQFAFYDFSKYKNDISNIDIKALVEFLKQSGAITYVLAPENQVKTVALTADEKAKGAVEKIRIQSTVDELMLQAELYALVNRTYLVESVLKVDTSKVAKVLSDQSEVYEASAEAEVVNAAAEALDTDPAQRAMYELHEAITHHFNDEEYEASDTEYVADATAETAVEATEAAVAAAVRASDDVYLEDDENIVAVETAQEESSKGEYYSEDASSRTLSEEQCSALEKDTSVARMGDVAYCDYYYEIDLITADVLSDTEHAKRNQAKQKERLNDTFTEYDQNQLVTAEQFKQLWAAHQSDIEASMSPQSKRTPLVMDVVLDAQGRAIHMDYDLTFDYELLQRKFNVKFNMEILNYGNATKIDRQALNQAKSFQDAFKGSLIETFTGKGKTSLSEEDSEVYTLSWDEQLEDLAGKVYLQTGSYDKTYKAVFIAKLTQEKPALIKQYSAKDLQEIATVYSYIFSDEDVYSLKGQALEKVQALQEKHHLNEDLQFDQSIGNDVDRIVLGVLDKYQSTIDVQKLSKQYKSAEAIFTQYYVQKFTAENTIENNDLAELQKTAKVLAKAYVALKAENFKPKLIQSLDDGALQFIDYAIFKETYQALLDAKIK